MQATQPPLSAPRQGAHPLLLTGADHGTTHRVPHHACTGQGPHLHRVGILNEGALVALRATRRRHACSSREQGARPRVADSRVRAHLQKGRSPPAARRLAAAASIRRGPLPGQANATVHPSVGPIWKRDVSRLTGRGSSKWKPSCTKTAIQKTSGRGEEPHRIISCCLRTPQVHRLLQRQEPA